MKTSIYYFLTLFAFSILVMLGASSCNKTTANEYIPECENIEGTTQTIRTENCKACCIANGWDRGVYWELAAGGTPVGCECFND